MFNSLGVVVVFCDIFILFVVSSTRFHFSQHTRKTSLVMSPVHLNIIEHNELFDGGSIYLTLCRTLPGYCSSSLLLCY